MHITFVDTSCRARGGSRRRKKASILRATPYLCSGKQRRILLSSSGFARATPYTRIPTGAAPDTYYPTTHRAPARLRFLRGTSLRPTTPTTPACSCMPSAYFGGSYLLPRGRPTNTARLASTAVLYRAMPRRLPYALISAHQPRLNTCRRGKNANCGTRNKTG